MENLRNSLFVRVWLTHFVPAFFVGAVLLLTVKDLPAPSLIPVGGAGDLVKAVLNGAAVALAVLLFHRWRNRRMRNLWPSASAVYAGAKLRCSALVGFLAGAADILLTLSEWGVLFLALLVLSVLVWNLRVFTRRSVSLLRPGSEITWADVNELLRVYLATLIGFTLVNAAVDGLHALAGITPPFDFASAGGELFLNALYYTVVTMTTLGFGDIVPRTWDGKILLIVQSLTSYFMFAFMIGIITRGVTSGRDR
ncbi:voltage-gated potassium channel [Pseudodesulfovibrio hydrargyri]|uniref:Voltage-gated potassium channel n=1 Tax=Pseudodesulfovibrio hydrargyri TaxID=2125990 RepID=A0A1J5N844_9BACT|nr:potassium channel family protein [Pseudodesulfovibrio hydrargyri]OIQ49463.1 voltage-gated potassium channel [Pseudodesulfovibrio hydrargyri]